MTKATHAINRRQFLKAGTALAGYRLLSLLFPSTKLQFLSAAARPQDAGLVYLPLVQKTVRVLQVGPSRSYKVPSAAASAAKDGDIVEIDAGDYIGDTATWRQSNLTLRGVGGKAHLIANGQNAGGKGTWVIQGDNTTVENIEFSGAAVPDENGAGIRQEGKNLIVRACNFHDNQEGILAGDNSGSEIFIEYSEFGYNGFGTGYTHNLYINHVARLTMQYCYSHYARVGHLVKSRAYENYILYNRIMDEAGGTSSYSIDLPNGGLAYIIGNLVQQGPATENPVIVTFAEEGASNPKQEIYLVNNTIVNDHSSVSDAFIRLQGAPAGMALNNLFIGGGTQISGPIAADHNIQDLAGVVLDRAGFNYHLGAGSPAIDAGRDPGSANGISLLPAWEYMHPLSQTARLTEGVLDVGAYEYHP